jgi:hypothetical protein
MYASNPPGAVQSKAPPNRLYRVQHALRRRRAPWRVASHAPTPRATAVVAFAVTNVDYIIVLPVLFARRDLRFRSLSLRGTSDSPLLVAGVSATRALR